MHGGIAWGRAGAARQGAARRFDQVNVIVARFAILALAAFARGQNTRGGAGSRWLVKKEGRVRARGG